MGNTVEYVGTVSGIEEKRGGWYRISLAVPGKQHPVKVETKLEPLIQKAREVRDAGSVATFKVDEFDSENINPNTQRPYIERRLQEVTEGATASGNGSQPQTAAQQGGAAMSKEEWRAKDAAADKRACIAIAAGALTHTMPSDPSDDDLKKFNQRVLFLASGWYRVVQGQRDHPAEDDVPFQ